jgi:hypothetical protein
VAEPVAPRWVQMLRDVGMFLGGLTLLGYEAVLRTGDPRTVLVAVYGAMMCGPVVLQSWLARKA